MTRSPLNITRRSVLVGTAAAGATGALAACGGSGNDNGAAATPTQASTTAPTGGDGQALAATSEIPVGGGKIFSSQRVVVTQPTAGSFKGFSAVCTHQGCLVGSVTNREILCPCHGSRYSVTDGSVTAGPAPSALPAVSLRVQNQEIILG